MGFDQAAVEMLLIGWVRFVGDGGRGLDVQAGRHVHHPRRPARGDRRRRRALVLRQPRRERRTWTSTSSSAKKQSSENPVYYVQYAHARIASILRKAAEAGLAAGADASRARSLAAPEGALARVVARLPEVVEDAAAAQETQGITAYATELATAFHAFYRDARVVDPDEPERSARASPSSMRRGSRSRTRSALLGISAPEAM